MRADLKGQTNCLEKKKNQQQHKWHLQDQWLSSYKKHSDIQIPVNFYLADLLLAMKEITLVFVRYILTIPVQKSVSQVSVIHFSFFQKKICITVTLSRVGQLV